MKLSATRLSRKLSHRLGGAADAVRTEFAKRKRTFQRVEPELAEEEIPIPEDELPLPKPSPVEFWLLKLARTWCSSPLGCWHHFWPVPWRPW